MARGGGELAGPAAGRDSERGPLTRVAVCVLSFRRPEGLARTLTGLARLEVEDGVDVRVVVVDNDAAGSAGPVVERLRPSLPWPVEYGVEPQRGIAHARNRAVAMAGDVDFVAFVDDDEVPSPAWLAELLGVAKSTAADVVAGPIIPRLPESTPEWIVRGRFFDRPRFVTGQLVTWATTGNVLIASRAFAGQVPPFPPRLALAGGEDTHFFMRLRQTGRRFAWADEAEVVEWVPPSRANLRWLLTREYRRGNTLSVCLVELEGSAWRKFRRAAGALGRIGHGLGLVVASVRSGRVGAVRGLRRMCFGAGQLSGLVGMQYQEYRRAGGS